jgi:AraC-like DNA-binding protein
MELLSGVGFFFTFVIFYFRNERKFGNIYLGLFFLFFNIINLLHYLFTFSNSKTFIAVLLSTPLYACIYLIGPFAFLYVRSILSGDLTFKKQDYLHFVMFAIVFLGIIPFNLANWDIKINAATAVINHSWAELETFKINKFISFKLNYYLRMVHLFGYLLYIWQILLSHKYESKKIFVEKNEFINSRQILFFFIGMITILSFCLFFLFHLYLTAHQKSTFLIQANVLIGIIFIGILLIMIALIFYPHLIFGIQQVDVDSEVLERKHKKPSLELDEGPKENFPLEEVYIEQIQNSLRIWEKEKKYLSLDATMVSLAKDINIPLHHLRYYFNQFSNEKFIDWRNNLRVDYAVELIKQGKGKDKTIETLGNESGFKTYSSFIQFFKQRTGVLPSDYNKNHNSNVLE